MSKNDLYSDNLNEHDQTTYINGLGFVNINKTRTIFFSIRKYSNILCLGIMLYYLLQKGLVFPCTYLMYYLGFDIHINFYTGLITSTPFVKTTVIFLSNFIALFCSSAFCFIINRKMIISAKIFKAPYKGVNSIAIPISVAIGILGISLSKVFSKGFEKLGIIFSSSDTPLTSINVIAIYSLLSVIILSVMQEILFRGIILTTLRQFGDGFAVISTSLLFALWYGGITEFIIMFLLSLPLCYFTIRSRSIYTSIISRIIFELIFFVYRLCIGIVEHSIAIISILIAGALIIIIAGFAFNRFIKIDKKAFYLKQPDDKMNAGVKTSIFSSSIAFIIFIAIQIMRIIQSTQFIG